MAEKNIQSLWESAIGNTTEDKLNFLLSNPDRFGTIHKLRYPQQVEHKLSFMGRLVAGVRRLWRRLTGQRWEKNRVLK